MKGQAEVVVIVGILLVAAIVAVYTTQVGNIVPSSVPEGVYEEQKLVANTIEDIISDATDDAVRTMMKHGGYLEEQIPGVGVTYEDVPHADFMLSSVPYWQQCENVMYPDIRDISLWMAAYVKEALLEGLDDIESLYGNRTVFDRSSLSVSVDVLGDEAFEPDRIDVTVTLPTTVRGYQLPSDLYPYEASIETKFGRIYSFGRDFAEASATNRYFDTLTIAAMYFSQEAENTHVKLPTYGVLTECGEVLHRSHEEINAGLLEVVEYVMTTMLWWEDMPVDFPNPKMFGIQELNGNVYDDLGQPQTLMTDGFAFNLFEYVFVTNFEMPKHGQYAIPVCTEVYNIGYSFEYPFVLRVRDTLTGYSFNIAGMVGIEEGDDTKMVPGSCGVGGIGTAHECESLSCSGRVRVVDPLGNPLPGSFVVFGDCPMGETDEYGYVEAPVQCGTMELYVSRDSDYEFLKRNVSSSVLAGTHTVVLNTIPDITFHFREVEIDKEGYYVVYDDYGDYYVVDTECGACPKSCPMTSALSYECNISAIEKEQAFVEFDNGYINLPVTNVVDVPEGCMDTPECERCNDAAQGVEYADDADAMGNASEDCRSCAMGCMSAPAEDVLVDYLTTGYTYNVDAVTYDPLRDFMINGGFDYEFAIERDYTDIYIYVPKRAADRGGYDDFELGDSEKECMLQVLETCGIEPVSTEEYPENTIYLTAAGCTCSRLESIAASNGLGLEDMFCACHSEGGDCCPTGSCSSYTTTCCKQDKSTILERMNMLLEPRGTRILCAGVGS